MEVIFRVSRPSPTPPPKPPDFTAPPSTPPKDWAKKWKFQDVLNRQNPMMSLTAAEMLTHTRTSKDQVDPDDAKKLARIAAIKAANKAKRKAWNSKVSGTGTVLPTLYSYPSSEADQAGTGFSFSDIPSVVWIVLAVAGGIFLIKSAGKGRRR